ncbi:hypothetical protein TNCV_3007291 [Trichonephila clavipes]|nr:hypothetical protein TNCV_3007291 [Trichonephila clavipes]
MEYSRKDLVFTNQMKCTLNLSKLKRPLIAVVNKKDTKMYEVSTRLGYAMRSVGKGEAAAKLFYGVLNMPPPRKRFYDSYSRSKKLFSTVTLSKNDWKWKTTLFETISFIAMSFETSLYLFVNSFYMTPIPNLPLRTQRDDSI